MGIKLTNSRELQALVQNDHTRKLRSAKGKSTFTSAEPTQQAAGDPSQPQLDLMEIFNALNQSQPPMKETAVKRVSPRKVAK